MDRSQLYTFVTALLAGIQPDETTFETYLDIAQARIEGLRPWVKLRAVDSTQTLSPSDTFQTPKTMPADFDRWYAEMPVVLVDANGSPLYLAEIPFYQRFTYQKAGGHFYTDPATNLLYVCGTYSQAQTIHQHYLKTSTLVSAAAGNSWIFPARFHKLLALMVAVFWKKGIDYDIISNVQADSQAGQAAELLDVMTTWDAELQQNAQRGLDPFQSLDGLTGTLNGNQLT